MCGIAGKLRFRGSNHDITTVQSMVSKLQRRGPDYDGIFSDEKITLGHARLSIIDLTSNSNQPMHDKELGLVLVFNGCIYNYKALRKTLEMRGYNFFSSGDSEVILKAYHAWGKDCVEHFDGIFAFAVWDLQSHSLFLARDRLGIKPLYYTVTKNAFYFASTMQALLASGDVDLGFDEVALHHHLTLHAVVPAPRTILKKVRKLAPAQHIQVSKEGKLKIKNYWELENNKVKESFSAEEWVHRVHELLLDSIKKRTDVADVPVGVLLSGGLDSSLLVALLSKLGYTGLQTFSIGFEKQPEEAGDEFCYSDKIADFFGTTHKRFFIDDSSLAERLPEAVLHMSEPMVAQDAIAFYLLAEQVSKDIKVVQSGQGADEVFAGYFWHQKLHQTSKDELQVFKQHYFDRSHQEIQSALCPNYLSRDFTSELVSSLLDKKNGEDFIDTFLRADITTFIVDDPIKRIDNMTMAWGLEARVPFLDIDLVKTAIQIPAEIKLKEGGKYPLRAIARDLLPNEVIDRPKGYFPVPALKYPRGVFLNLMQEILTSKACKERGLFEYAYIEKLMNNPEKYTTPIEGNKLWHMALLELWLQSNLDSLISR